MTDEELDALCERLKAEDDYNRKFYDPDPLHSKSLAAIKALREENDAARSLGVCLIERLNAEEDRATKAEAERDFERRVVKEQVKLVDAAHARATTAWQERDEAVKALEPFAIYADYLNSDFPDHADDVICTGPLAAERERCAKVADAEAAVMKSEGRVAPEDSRACFLWAEQTASDLAAAIRALTPSSPSPPAEETKP